MMENQMRDRLPGLTDKVLRCFHLKVLVLIPFDGFRRSLWHSSEVFFRMVCVKSPAHMTCCTVIKEH